MTILSKILGAAAIVTSALAFFAVGYADVATELLVISPKLSLLHLVVYGLVTTTLYTLVRD